MHISKNIELRGLIVLRENGSNNTLLYGDGSATFGGNVGVGTDSPGNLLTIHAGTSTDGDVTVLRLNNDETALADGDGVSM